MAGAPAGEARPDVGDPSTTVAPPVGVALPVAVAPPVPAGSEVALIDAVRAVGLAAGLDAIGVAPADPFLETRRHLRERKAAGLHAGMAFTYRNPVRSTEPSAALPGVAAIVVGARAYLRRPPTRPEGGRYGRVARYAWTDAYAPLREALGAVADHLRGAGHRARVLADDNALVDREAAVRAGLGWYGKNANVLLTGRGSWFVLGSVLTDAPLVPAAESVADGCGGCTRCLRGCPTGAIVAPGVIDSRRCLAWLVQAPGWFPPELRQALGDRLYGCDDCQEVCPLNRPQGNTPEAGAGARPWVDAVAWLSLSDADLVAAAGTWYVPERHARYLRRNALLVLGNAGDPRDPEVVEAVTGALGHPDPLVRGHAVWAATRLGWSHLADGLAAAESDPGVLAELARRPQVDARPA